MAVTQLKNQQAKGSRESTPSSSAQQLQQQPRVKAEEVDGSESLAPLALGPPSGAEGANSAPETSASTGSPGRAVKAESPGAGSAAAILSTAVPATLTEPEQADSGSETDEGGLVVTSLLREGAAGQVPEGGPPVSTLGKRKADEEPDESDGIESRRIKAETD
jgi:hypothetical protein